MMWCRNCGEPVMFDEEHIVVDGGTARWTCTRPMLRPDVQMMALQMEAIFRFNELEKGDTWTQMPMIDLMYRADSHYDGMNMDEPHDHFEQAVYEGMVALRLSWDPQIPLVSPGGNIPVRKVIVPPREVQIPQEKQIGFPTDEGMVVVGIGDKEAVPDETPSIIDDDLEPEELEPSRELEPNEEAELSELIHIYDEGSVGDYRKALDVFKNRWKYEPDIKRISRSDDATPKDNEEGDFK